MEKYTSEEALNGILNILKTVVNDYAQNNSGENNKNQTSDLITQLMGGVVAGSRSGVSIGIQVEQLAGGMKLMKDSGITDRDGQMVASVISSIGSAIENLAFSDVNTASVKELARALRVLGSIDSDILENIVRFSQTDIDGSNIIKFINSLASINIKKSDINEIITTLKKFGAIDKDDIENIVNISKSLSSDSLEGMKDFVLAFQIEEESLKNVRNGIKVISLVSSIDKEALENLKYLKKLDPSLAINLRKFIYALDFSDINVLSDKKMKDNLNALMNLLRGINSIIDNETGTMRMMLLPLRGKLMGKAIGQFFTELIKGIPREKIELQLAGVAEILKVMEPFVGKDSKHSI